MARIEWIDAAKGLAIALIVVGHIWSLSQPPPGYLWLFAFHVPVFFFLTGLTLDPARRSLAAAVRQRARTLLVPYVCYALLGYLFFVGGYLLASMLGASLGEFDYGFIIPLLGILHGTAGNGYLVNSPLWFLPALFIAVLLVQAVCTLTQREGLRAVLIGGVMAAGIAIGDRLLLPFSLVPALIGAGFVYIGLLFARDDPMAPARRPLLWLALVASAGISLAAPVNGMVGMADGSVQQPGLFLLFAINGIALCLLVVRLVPAPVRALLARMGRHSLEILVLHMLVIKAVKVLMTVVTGRSITVLESSAGAGLVILAVTAVLLVPLVWVVRRWLSWTLGRDWGAVRAVA